MRLYLVRVGNISGVEELTIVKKISNNYLLTERRDDGEGDEDESRKKEK